MEELEIYQSEDGSLELSVTVSDETVWLSQYQMQTLFGRERSVITKHINNVFKDDELAEKSNVQKMHIANSDKPVKYYSLDVVISVGYIVKSVQGVKFRQWATRTLKSHLLKGFSINENRLHENASELEKALKIVQRAASLPRSGEFGAGLVDILARYTSTFLWLQQYDEGLLVAPKGMSGGELTPLNDATRAIL